MNSAFTVYWSRVRVQYAETGGLPDGRIPFLFGGPHVSQPSFTRAGVAVGDVIYPITLRGECIHVLCRFTVARILTIADFIKERRDLYLTKSHGRWEAETLDSAAQRHPWHRAVCWTCSDHVLLPSAVSVFDTTRTIPADALQRLTYSSKKAERAMRWAADGKTPLLGSIDRIYRLASTSAADFAKLLADAT